MIWRWPPIPAEDGASVHFFREAPLFPQSDLALATEGNGYADLTLELGYAHVFLVSDFDITVGGDIRPAYRMIVPLTVSNIMNGVSDLTALPTISGFGIALDAGTTVEWRNLTFGRFPAGYRAHQIQDV